MRLSIISILLMLIFSSGCEFRRVATRNTNITDTLEKQYKIYEDLDRNKNVTESSCQILFNDPENENIRIGASGVLPDAQEDRSRWSEQLAVEGGNTGSFPDELPPVTDPTPPPSSSGFSDRLFGEGGSDFDNSTNFDNRPSTNGNNAFANEDDFDDFAADNPPRTFGTRDNTVFTLTIKEINPVNFNDIRLSYLTAQSATVETLGIAQITMKDATTNRLQERPYDDVDVIVKYFLEQNANGTWQCKESTVDITTTPIRRDRDDDLRNSISAGGAIVRW